MKLLRLSMLLAAPLLLASCLLTPGKFTSNLTINADRSFTFAYKGEVIALDPGSEFDKSGTADPDPNASPDQQAEQAAKKAEAAKKAAELETKRKAMAEALAKEAGYRSVAYLGDGKFMIDYAASGILTTNYIFPFNLDAEIAIPFVALEVRKEGTVRMKAPAFGKSRDQSPSAMNMGMPDTTDTADGTFTLTTNAEIVMHNNEDGVKPAGAMKTIAWRVTPLSKDAPVAVLRMTR